MGAGEGQRGADLEGAAVRAGRADQDAAVAQAVDDADRGGAVRLAGGGVGEVGRRVQAARSDGADPRRVLGDRLQRVAQVGTHGLGVLPQPLGLDHVQDRGRGGDADRVAAERVEVPDLVTELLEDLGAGRDPGDRHAVAHRLAHDGQVGHDAVALEAPHRRPGAAEPGLDLVGDVQPAGRADHAGDRPQEPDRVGPDPVGGEQAVRDERGQPDAVPVHVGDRRAYSPSQGLAVVVGSWCRDRPHRTAQRDGRAKAGRDLGGGRGHAVVGVGGDDDALAAGVEAGDAQRQVDRLAAGAGEHDVADTVRVRAEQPLGVVEDQLAGVPGVRVEGRGLAGDRLHHPRVAVPDRWHVVVRVQVRLPVRVVQVHALAPDDPHRVGVEQLVGRAEQAGPPFDDLAQLGVEGVDRVHVEAVDHGRGVTHGSPPGCARRSAHWRC